MHQAMKVAVVLLATFLILSTTDGLPLVTKKYEGVRIQKGVVSISLRGESKTVDIKE
ncbi:hypothetical protein OS493_027666, partial [Desmophyllum pertusum]